MSAFIVVPKGSPCPPFFGNALEALTEAAATGGDVYAQWGKNRREGMRIELAGADAALQTVVVAAEAASAAAEAEAAHETANESDTSSVSAQSDEECSFCEATDCDRICGVVAKRVCREWEEAEFWPPTWSARAPDANGAEEGSSLPSGGPSF